VVAGLSGCQVWCEKVLDDPHMAKSPVDASGSMLCPTISAPSRFRINSGHIPLSAAHLKETGWVQCHPEAFNSESVMNVFTSAQPT